MVCFNNNIKRSLLEALSLNLWIQLVKINSYFHEIGDVDILYKFYKYFKKTLLLYTMKKSNFMKWGAENESYICG